MRAAGRVIGTMGALAIAAPIGLIVATPASAHGAMDNPISRSYLCYQEAPENPITDVCQAVVAAGGTQPLYDWMEVNIANAAGNHRTLIPDGQLCSAGRDKYRGLDLARSDWPTTTLPSGGSSFTFEYRATAPHAGGYEFYVTKDGYDPNQPLRWTDLEDTPFHVEDSPQLVDGYYLMEATLPDKQGRHLIYAIWQRTDSPEAFYACSDVVFGEGGDNSAPPSRKDGDGALPGSDDPADGDGGGNDGDNDGDDGTCSSGHDDGRAATDDEEHPHGDEGGTDSGSDEATTMKRSFWRDLFAWWQRGRDQDAAFSSDGPSAVDDRADEFSHAAHGAHDDTLAVAATGPDDKRGGVAQPAIVGLTAAALGAALILAKPGGAHRRKPTHRKL